MVMLTADNAGLLVKGPVARAQLEAETSPSATSTTQGGTSTTRAGGVDGDGTKPTTVPAVARRFYGTVRLDPARVGRDASRIADEVIAHLSGLDGAEVSVTLEIQAEIPAGAPDNVVRTVTENSRTLKFTSQGFERD